MICLVKKQASSDPGVMIGQLNFENERMSLTCQIGTSVRPTNLSDLTNSSYLNNIENNFQFGGLASLPAKVMEEEVQVLRDHLVKKRLKKTSQRETILEVFLQAKRHLTVEELHSLVKHRDPSIGLTTVYRTMKLFCECNLARANYFQEGRVRYEPQHKTAHHDHMICLNCGEALEFVNDQIERLQEKMAAKYGFHMTNHRMEIFGYCKDCRRSSKRSELQLL